MTTIKDGSQVSFHYTLKVEGHVVDSSDGGDPFQHVQGSNRIVRGLENRLEGLAVGDKKNIVVQPDEGYGVSDPAAVQKVPRSAFTSAATLEAGHFVEGEGEEGPIKARILDVDAEHVTLDLNHPLAGKTLEFQIEIVGIQ